MKTRSSKTRKIKIFAKGLPMVLVQNWPSFHLFFQALQTRKMCCTIFQNDKMPLQAIKTASSKRGKIAIFAKGLTHGFGPKLAIFQSFFQALQSRKMCFTIFYNKKTPFQAIKTASSKSGENCDFCKGVNPWFWFKIGHFSIFCFQAIQGRKMCLTIFQNEKTPFQAIRTASSKRGKIAIFAKGLTHGFGPKLAISPSFVFRQYRAGKCVLRYSRTKKRLSRL